MTLQGFTLELYEIWTRVLASDLASYYMQYSLDEGLTPYVNHIWLCMKFVIG